MLAHVFRYFFGIIFIFSGAIALAGIVSAYSIVLLSDKIIFPTDVQMVLEIMLGSALGTVCNPLVFYNDDCATNGTCNYWYWLTYKTKLLYSEKSGIAVCYVDRSGDRCIFYISATG